jgi:abhydrolase domain-containing protein 6
MRRAGLKKHFLTINDENDETMTFCYAEKGSKIPEQPSIIFIHGFSSDKHTWLNMIKVKR